ncbi:MAG: DUF3291 domain-containing protein [Chloroflexi bacterium]|nr:MAG: DUF3291 domain-containing protein [Chloroflexota bacterium]
MESHLAQYNIARLVAALDDPRIADFVANLDRVNRLGDQSPGFAWRYQTEEGNSTSVRVRDDELILVNFTVWESIEALFEFTYRSGHAEVYRRRREWFEAPREAHLVLWWVPAGHLPSLQEAEERLDHLRAHGPTPQAFTFKQRFPPPPLRRSTASSPRRTIA